MTQIYDANRYIARMLGDNTSLTTASGVALNQPSGIFWEHAWEMLIPMKQTGSEASDTTEAQALCRMYGFNSSVGRKHS